MRDMSEGQDQRLTNVTHVSEQKLTGEALASPTPFVQGMVCMQHAIMQPQNLPLKFY